MPGVLIVSWVGDHGRSRGLARVLGADAVFMPWADARRSLARSALGWCRSSWRTWRIVRQLSPGSVVVVMCPPVFAVLAALLAAGRSRRVVVDAHSGSFNDPRWRWTHPLLRALLRHVSLVLVTNLQVAERFDHAGTRMMVVHDPMVPVSGQAPASASVPAVTDNYVVFPASGAPDEPLEAVFGAAALLNGDPLVVVTGSASRGLSEPGLVGTGFLDDAAYDTLLRRARAVLALTTRDATMQRAAYEALERDVPIVCSSSAVLRETLRDAATSCDNDATSMADAIRVAVARDRDEAAAAAAAVRGQLGRSVDRAARAIRELADMERHDPLVTIVIDNYNYARFLPRSIDSALAQSYDRVEIVVVDDGSTDSSFDVLAAYAGRAEVVRRTNGGQAAALNTGFALSRGEIVIFLDSDDELHPDAVARVVDRFTPEVAKVHFRLTTVDADGAPLGFTNPTRRSRLAQGNVSRQVLHRGRYVTPVMSGNAYARWALERIMPIPETDFRISADGYLVALTALHGRVVAIDDELGVYRVHGSNAWAPHGVDAARLRALIRHDLARYRAVAETNGVDVTTAQRRLSRHDQAHLRSRIALSRLADDDTDSRRVNLRARLVVAGMVSAMTAPGMSSRQRASFLAWFPLVGFAPRGLACRAVRLLHDPQARYAAVSRHAKALSSLP